MKTSQGYKYTVNYFDTMAEAVRFTPIEIIKILINIHRPECLKKAIHDLNNEK